MIKTIRKIEVRSKRIKVESPRAPYGDVPDKALTAPETVAAVADRLLEGEDQECFLVFLLDNRNRVLGFAEVARGAVESCPVDPRMVFRAAVVQAATGIILVHNHPSGDPEPSAEDDRLTRKLEDGAELLGIQILDHVVIGEGAYYSYREHAPTGRLVKGQS